MNNQEFEIFKVKCNTGTLLFTKADDFLGKVIEYGQRLRDPTDPNCNLTHVAFVIDNMIFESCIVQKGLWFKSGIMIRPLDAWKNKNFNSIVFKNINPDKIIIELSIFFDCVKMESERLKAKKLFYPIIELIGTVMANISYKTTGMMFFMGKEWIEKKQCEIIKQTNVFDKSDRRYCAAFANHCFETAGLRLIPKTTEESVCQVNDLLKDSSLYI
jgi:hypothetical protein